MFLFLQINYSFVFQHSYLYSNSNKDAYEKFLKPYARVRYILFETETKIQQQKTKCCFYFYMLI